MQHVLSHLSTHCLYRFNLPYQLIISLGGNTSTSASAPNTSRRDNGDDDDDDDDDYAPKKPPRGRPPKVHNMTIAHIQLTISITIAHIDNNPNEPHKYLEGHCS